MARALAGPIIALYLLGAGIAPAAAQMETREGIALQNQILELQREIQVLSQRGGGATYAAPYQAAPPSGASGDLVARLLTRVDALEAAVRDLRGQVDQLTNQVQQQSAQLSKRLDDLQFQMQNPQARAAAGAPSGPAAPSSTAPLSTAPPPPPSSPAAASPPPPAGGKRTPELSLREGDAALGRHDYATAERDARDVLANRASPRAYDAQYLLAQSLMGQRQYSQAAIAYDDAYNRQKKGVHAANSLLGLADSLTAINEKRAACDTIAKLRREFPSASAELRDHAAQTAKRAGCS